MTSVEDVPRAVGEPPLLSQCMGLVARFRVVLIVSAIAGAVVSYTATARLPAAYDAEARLDVAPRAGESRVSEVMSALATVGVMREVIREAGLQGVEPQTLLRDHLALRNPRGSILVVTARLPDPDMAAAVANGFAHAAVRFYYQQGVRQALANFDLIFAQTERANARTRAAAEELSGFVQTELPLPSIPESAGASSREYARLKALMSEMAAERQLAASSPGPRDASPTAEGTRLSELARERDALLELVTEQAKSPEVDAVVEGPYRHLRRLISAHEIALSEQSAALGLLHRAATEEPTSVVRILSLAVTPTAPATPQPVLAAFAGLAFATAVVLLALSLVAHAHRGTVSEA